MRMLRSPFMLQYSSSTVTRFLKRFASTDPRNKAPFVRDKTHINVCCLGQSGHGKTALSSAITLLQSKVNCAIFKSTEEIDKSSDERAKGQSITPCKIEFTTPSKHIVLSDLPGAEEYVKNTIFGACGSDIAIVVINCDEGPTEQTRRHLVIARHSGIKQLIGFINCFDDEGDNESLELCELATREMLIEEGFISDKVIFIHGSASKALKSSVDGLESIDKLISTLDSFPNPERDLSSPGLFYVDKIYNPQGRGTGVTGIMKRGKFIKGQMIDCLGVNRLIKTKINYIECFNKVLEETLAGDCVEIVLQGVKKDDLTRGMTLGPPGEYNQQNNLQVMLQLLKPQSNQKPRPLITTAHVNIQFETSDLLGQIVLPSGRDYLMPGSSDLVQIKLTRSCVLLEDQSLLIRDGNQIIGIGKISKLLDPLTNEEQLKMNKGRTRKEKDEFRLLVEKVQNELNL